MANIQRTVLSDIGPRVAKKEEARALGLSQLEIAKPALHADAIGRSQQGLQEWVASLNLLHEAPKSREILVGVIGETGLGKSSLINALLGCNIVPTSSSEACTAAVCIFGWNDDVSNGNNFRAHITFKSYETVEAELDALKYELSDLEETSQTQGEHPDQEHEERRAQAQRQMRNVANWSRLSLEAIRKSSPAQIIANSSAFAEIFRSGRGDRATSTFKLVKAARKKEFLAMLKPYVSSSKDVASPTRYWPLVEQVEIFLKAGILRHGIKLVDLPGVMDALESRAQIARSYLYRLEKRIVVTPATRAADNRAAADLVLSERETMFLDMDNMLKGDSLCVAITKTDDIDDLAAESEFPTPEILAICDEINRRGGDDDDEEAESGDDTIYGNAVDMSCSTGEKRPRADDVQGRSAVRQRMDGDGPDFDLSHLSTGTLKSLRRQKCIVERNKILKQRVTDNLLSTRNKNKKSRASASADTLPSVFPVSSRAFQALRLRDKTSHSDGFPDRDSTGIPDLEDWLHQVSLPYREEWVDGDINHIQVLFDAVDGWNQNDHHAAYPRLSSDQKTELERNMVILCNHLNEPELERAVDLFNRAVKGWEKKNPRANVAASSRHEKTFWSTYRACVRRNGGPFIRRAKTGQPKSIIFWIEDVSHAFWQGHFDQWAYEFTRRIPILKGKIRGAGLRALAAWLKDLYDNESLPVSFRELVKASAFKLDHLVEKYVADVRERVTQFQASSRAKRDPVQRSLALMMKPGFEAAIKHTGQGLMAKQIEDVIKHADNVGFTMFETVRNDLEKDLTADIKKVSADVSNLWKHSQRGCGTLIKAELNRIAKGLYAKKTKKHPSARMSNITQQALSTVIATWRSEWAKVFICLPDAFPLDDFEEAAPNAADEADDTVEEESQVVIKREALEGVEEMPMLSEDEKKATLPDGIKSEPA
ncbi:tat pathway signal sequence [Colletotrichum scovillei]|uniref:Tat pathway signal sequence n=1 Tax=Colletotrichum scovillei TaxID=1209932 RepID=A0A9P7RDP0_9PEZI|nr:tat pathway signal sequence [Colletotrichum scovillei]KAG7075171.1 tat pathway signal sequence [Colletotrichum scovillei]KAG7082268.1 tat pathway signal sequence [Colletotrichum scovillei]